MKTVTRALLPIQIAVNLAVLVEPYVAAQIAYTIFPIVLPLLRTKKLVELQKIVNAAVQGTVVTADAPPPMPHRLGKPVAALIVIINVFVNAKGSSKLTLSGAILFVTAVLIPAVIPFAIAQWITAMSWQLYRQTSQIL